jgi:branched-chain amino acid transport system ATP-binding protein
VNGVHKRFGPLDVLIDFNLVLDPGAMFALVGSNGSGKTTLLNVITGAEAADRGSIRLVGRNVGTFAAWRRAAAGIARTFQSSRLWPDLTVREHFLVAESPSRRGGAKPVLDRIGFSSGLMNAFPDELRLLDRRRAEIGLALLHAPALLLVDEIGAGLNREEARSLYNLISSMVRGDEVKATILVEHRLDLLLEFADEIGLLSNGAIELRARADCADDVRRLSERMFVTSMRMPRAAENRIT